MGGQFHDACLPAWVKYFEVQRQRNKALGRPWASPNMEVRCASKGFTRRPLRVSRCVAMHAAVTTAARRLLKLAVSPPALPCLHPDWSCAAPVCITG